MNVKIEKTGKTVKFKKNFKKATDLLKELKISPDSVLIVKNGDVILAEEELKIGDEVVLLSVVSGG